MKILILVVWCLASLVTLAWWRVFVRNPNNLRRP